MIQGIPYGLILNVVALGVAVYAFIESGPNGRIAILVLMGTAFLLPVIFPSRAVALACLIGKTVIALGCYLYIRWSNAA